MTQACHSFIFTDFFLSVVLNRQLVSEGGLEEGDYEVHALLLSLFCVCSASVFSSSVHLIYYVPSTIRLANVFSR